MKIRNRSIYAAVLALGAATAAFAGDSAFSQLGLQSPGGAGIKTPVPAVAMPAGRAVTYTKGAPAGVPTVQSWHQALELQTAVRDNYVFWYMNAATIPNSHRVSLKIDGYEFGYASGSPVPVRDFIAVIRKAVEGSIYLVRDTQTSGVPVWEISRREPLLSLAVDSSDDVIYIGNPSPNEIFFATYRGLAVDGGRIKVSVNGRTIRVSTKRGDNAEDVARRLAGEIQSAGFGVKMTEMPGSGEGITRILRVSGR
ncbi:MAG: hypothetical protein HY746_00730 [Elusimicrobia bacterium]|nr:hypothetical protein [Elusimicrobiota bacterium]